MSFTSVEKMLAEAASSGLPLDRFLAREDRADSGLTAEQQREQLRRVFSVMAEGSRDYSPADRSRSGLVGGGAALYETAYAAGKLLGGEYLNRVVSGALRAGERNACMKRIVAAPTAGSCGVLPAVLLPLYFDGEITEDEACGALTVAGGFGEVIAARATLAGAQGGCQAEIGSASAMAGAALVFLRGGTPEMCANAVSMALSNLLGLACDPVAGLVEVPCVKRNVVGALNAVSAANMALAGLGCVIPCDEVIDAMGQVGEELNANVRETGTGGLAGTPTGMRIAAELFGGERTSGGSGA